MSNDERVLDQLVRIAVALEKIAKLEMPKVINVNVENENIKLLEKGEDKQ